MPYQVWWTAHASASRLHEGRHGRRRRSPANGRTDGWHGRPPAQWLPARSVWRSASGRHDALAVTVVQPTDTRPPPQAASLALALSVSTVRSLAVHLRCACARPALGPAATHLVVLLLLKEASFRAFIHYPALQLCCTAASAVAEHIVVLHQTAQLLIHCHVAIDAGLTWWSRGNVPPSAPPSAQAASSATRARRRAVLTRAARPAAKVTAAGPPRGVATRPLLRLPPLPQLPRVRQCKSRLLLLAADGHFGAAARLNRTFDTILHQTLTSCFAIRWWWLASSYYVREP